MPAERESQPYLEPESSEPSGPRKRKNSGFATRGEGIRVQGDAPFDPYRFQTFEVTPAFRRRVLEAQLPLLEPRDSFLELTPQGQQPVRAGANDTTLPEMPAVPIAVLAEAITEPMAPLPTPNPRATTVTTPSEPRRRWLVMGAALMVVLGFLGTYLAMRGHNERSKDPSQLQSGLRSRAH